MVRTVMRPRFSRRSHSRYRGLRLLAAPAAGPGVDLAIDMDLDLLPQRVEIAVELGRATRRKRRRTAVAAVGERDRMVRLHPPGPPRQHNYPLGHCDGL